MSENTSAVYTVWRAIMRLLRETSWPAITQNAKGVVVYFGDPDLAPQSLATTTERVVVASGVNTPDETWGPIGRYSRDENFIVYLYAATAIPGRTAEQARDRLEEITAALEQFVRGINSGRQAGTSPPEFDPYPTWFIEVSALNPLIQTDNQGSVGKAEIQLRCKFRIGTPPV